MAYELTYRPPKGSTLRKHQQNRTLMPGTRRQQTVLSPKTNYTSLQIGLKRELPVQPFLKRL